ncbi:hypothetical protein [Psychroflexus aestuariivivens]|uniref:hypothetical protein n=1 Tax=Psychroflexus aestuariivivens TaxID=1795040 RepID=UPI001EFFE4C6|nr:hypothetical protein [Psychroflexus aestuariivivens]
MPTLCIFNGEVWELKPKVWDLFSNFTTEKRSALLLWSPLKDTLPVAHNTKMIMKKVLVIALLIFGFSSCTQELTCADFKTGEFLIPADSLYAKSFKVIRKGGQQIEFDEKGDKTLVDIKYKDDCNYVLTYNEDSNNLDESNKYINASGGVKVEVLEIKGDTLFYSGVIENDSLRYEMPGKLVKLK